MKNLILDLIKVTENAAIKVADEIGRFNPSKIDQIAVSSFIEDLSTLDAKIIVELSEGEKDGMDHIKSKTEFGQGEKRYSVICDFIDGTNATATNNRNAISCLALGNEGAFHTPENVPHYMWKACFNPQFNSALLKNDDTIEDMVLKMKSIKKDLNICFLDRPRNQRYINEFKKLGCRITLFKDCDINFCLSVLLGKNIDAYMSIGGYSEGLLSAASSKCCNGRFYGQLVKDNEPFGKIYTQNELVKGHAIFVASGVTDSAVFKSVKVRNSQKSVHTIIMNTMDMTIRSIDSLYTH